ncbi:hypothetical protein BSL78_28965 [Apostichopus japonicus]|uniref:Ig-like domain-containing protein n=1 Tax=Stichopus japonicus TaxID=307972 RepID=A0A2G8JER2_STIJA|nr:hypothetical protein BSL78_28965 [Apostichopus japonicus]
MLFFIVKPAITIPVIKDCSNTYGTTCVKSTTDSVEVNCFVTDSRPAVILSWSLRTHGGDHMIPSNYMKFTIDNVTFTSHVTATFSFGVSSVLSLLVCRANIVPLNLIEDENVILIEKEMYYTSLATPIRTYLKIHSPMNLSCADLGLNVVIWKWSHERDAFKTLYVSIFQNSNHTKISNREYKLEDEGSLSLQNTLVEHEGLYACVYDNGVGGGIVLYDVLVMGRMFNIILSFMLISLYCITKKVHRFSSDRWMQPPTILRPGETTSGCLTCSVLGIRPKVALEWRAFREETLIDFTQHQFTVTQMGDLYDISLTVNFDFTQTIQNKVTVECRAVGENAELFSLSTKVDLLFTNVLPTEQGSHTSTITIIAVVVIMMIIIIAASVVIIFRIRARKLKMKRNKPGDTENEGIPMMENTNACEDIRPFVQEIRARMIYIWAKTYVSIPAIDHTVIMHARKSILFNDANPWTKKDSKNSFDVTIGSRDGAEVCELVGLFILHNLKQHLNPADVGLYRDDGLAALRTRSGRSADMTRKEVTQLFNKFGLKDTIETNLQVVNYLDITMNLANGSFAP